MPAQHKSQPGRDSSASEPHRHRQVAEGFGADAGRYDRARPGYPAALVEQVTAASPGPRVLDVGCGTGIAARQFQAAGCRVLGVDPDARMADLARQSGVEVEVAAFETWDPAGRAFDAVIAGQAWHWVDPAAGAAKAAQVLRLGGQLAAFWHVFEPPQDVAEVVGAVFNRLVPDSPLSSQTRPSDRDRIAAGFTARAADGIREADGFGDPERWRCDWERSYSRDEWLDQLATSGTLTPLPPDRLGEVLAAVGAALDGMEANITVRLTTVAIIAARTGAA